MKKLVIILSVVSALFVGIVIGYVVIPKMGSEPIVIAADSFLLASYSSIDDLPSEEAEELRQARLGDENINYPYNKHGAYYNRFFLKRDEEVDIVVKSSTPINTSRLTDGLHVQVSYITYEGHWRGNSGGSGRRVDGNWEWQLTYTADEDAWYFLEVVNYTTAQPWCQYVVVLKK